MDPEIVEKALGFLIKIPLLFLVLLIVLMIHEAGHYLAARMFKMKVQRFVIGTGRNLLQTSDRHNTKWSLNLIPFGAHVEIAGLAEGAQLVHAYWKRALTILAGPAFNLATPFIVLFAFYLIIGQPSIPPVIVGIEHGQKAQELALQPGDRFLEINDHKVLNYRHIWREGYDGGAIERDYKIARGDQIIDLTFSPNWTQYRDEDGIERKNARYGILWEHKPYKLKAILAINGENVKDNETRAREILLKNLDKNITIALKGPEKDVPYVFDIFLSSASNPHLSDKDHDGYKKVYLGAARDNFYLRQPAADQIKDASAFVLSRIKNIAKLPFQIFPIDRQAITDEAAVEGHETPITNFIYAFIYKLTIASIIIALINLLPLPYLDGGHLMIQTIECIRKKPITRKTKAWLFAACFCFVYFSVLMANKDNLSFYIDSRLQKVNQFINKQNIQTAEDSDG